MKIRKLSVLVLCIALLISVFTSCGSNDTHTHTFDEKWESDASNHWHPATCEHTSEHGSSAAHTDIDKNGICDVCGYDYNHTHTYQADTEWTYDFSQHWHAATCDHNVDPIGVANHVDENNDGICDVCSCSLAHQDHVYSESWTTDSESHWHTAMCGHDVISEKGAHTANAAGFCTVCGVRMENQEITSVAQAIKAAKLQEKVVYAGVINSQGYYSSKNTINFEKNGQYLWMYDSANDIEYMYSLIDENTICALETSWGYTTRNNSATVSWIDGYHFMLMDNNAQGEAYGIVNLVAQLYELAVENENHDFTETVGEDGTYSFEFGISLDYYGTPCLYKVAVSFTLDEEVCAMSSANVRASKYSFNQCEECQLKDENGAIVTDEYNEPITYYVVKEDESAENWTQYEVTQKVRPFDSKFLPDKLLVNSFDLVCEDPAVAEELTPAPTEISLEMGGDNNRAVFYFTNILPLTATLDLNGCSFSVTDSEGNELGVDWISPLYVFFSTTNEWDGSSHITIIGQQAGTYTLTVTCGLDSKTIKVTVTQPLTTSIAANVISVYGVQEVMNEVSIYVGSSLNFNSSVDVACDGSYTAEITAGNENSTATLTAGTATLWGSDVDVTVFKATAVGTYTVTLTSTVAEGISGTLVIHVTEAPSIDDILTGKYVGNFYGTKAWEVEFNSDASTVTIKDCLNGNKTGVYSYSYENGQLSVTQLEGDLKDVLLMLSDDMTLTIFNGYMSFELEKDTSSGTPDDPNPPVSGDKTVVGSATYENETATDVTESATYHVTIGANEKVYFGMYYYSLPDMFADYDITVICTVGASDVQLYEIQTTPVGDSEYAISSSELQLAMNMDTGAVYFAIENKTDSEITIEFTVELEEFLGWD